MRLLISLALLGLFLVIPVPQSTEAPTGFDNKSNGVADGYYSSGRSNEIRLGRATKRWPWTAL
jgi:hypothetical protein